MLFSDRSTPIGKAIDAYLKGEAEHEDHVIHLLFSANRWEAAAQMRADIADGITLIVDRYYMSGIVYSAAKQNPDLDATWARQPEVGLPEEDLTVFLSLDPQVARTRGDFGDEVYERAELQTIVLGLFEGMLSGMDGSRKAVITANRSVMEVESAIREAVDRMLGSDALEKPLRSVS